MTIVRDTGYQLETRKIKINGDAGASFILKVKTGSNYYNFATDAFSSIYKDLKDQKITPSGTYEKNIKLPKVSSDTRYDVYITPSPGTSLGINTGLDQKVGTITQRGLKTMTFNVTTAAGLTIQNSGSVGSDLVGGTIKGVGSSAIASGPGEMIQSGTITKSGSPLLYVSDAVSWDTTTEGNFTNSTVVTAEIVSKNGVDVGLDSATGISAGYYISGDAIVDDITVSSISGNKIVLSADQRVTVGETLTFSPGGWEIKNIIARIQNSGTNSLSMKMTAKVSKIGKTNITSVCDADNFVSLKPNVFPVSAECPAGGNIHIVPHIDCLNANGSLGDDDANQSGKTYKIHSLPSASTASPDPVGVYGVIKNGSGDDYAADDNMGSAGDSFVAYHAHAEMVDGDTDHLCPL